MKFEGFRRPRSNFYRLPNDWFQTWQQVRRQTGQARILGALKITEYVMKWTWGYGNYSDPVRLSWTDFQEGRRTGDGRRHDRGTGLSRSALSSAITLAVQVGLLERAGSTYLPRLMPPERDQDGFLGGEEEKFQGFASPEANYFVVPAIWTDLIADCTLETTILVVEYFFRHTWGWRGGWDKPCWMTEEEIATGRRKQSGDRYDNGTGYSVRAVHDALAEAIRRGWLVWRRSDSGGREYALHLEGMRVSDSGEFLLGQAKQQKASADPVIGDQHSVVPPISRDQQVAALEQQVRRLTTLLLGLLRTLENAGFDVVNLLPGREEVVPGNEEVVPVSEEVVPVSEEVVPVSEEVVPPCNTTDTFSDTYKQTPTAANTGGLVAAVGIAAAASLPEDLQQKLEALGFRGVKPMQELLEAYRQDPTRVRWWIEHLAVARAGDPRAGGFLLQTVVREKAPVPPLIASPAATSPAGRCSFCGGQGFVLADVPSGHPLYGQQIPCPRCSNGGGH
jgi:hypothetical protein